MLKKKEVSRNHVISEDEVSDLKILEGLPPITLNVKNLHIHLDERMFSHSEFGGGQDDEEDSAEVNEDSGFSDCGLDCDGHCESCEFCGKGDDEDEPFEDDSDDDDDDEDDEETPINDLIETLHTQTGIRQSLIAHVIDETFDFLEKRVKAEKEKEAVKHERAIKHE